MQVKGFMGPDSLLRGQRELEEKDVGMREDEARPKMGILQYKSSSSLDDEDWQEGVVRAVGKYGAPDVLPVQHPKDYQKGKVLYWRQCRHLEKARKIFHSRRMELENNPTTWLKLTDKQGEEYYYNFETGTNQWERPVFSLGAPISQQILHNQEEEAQGTWIRVPKPKESLSELEDQYEDRKRAAGWMEDYGGEGVDGDRLRQKAEDAAKRGLGLYDVVFDNPFVGIDWEEGMDGMVRVGKVMNPYTRAKGVEEGDLLFMINGESLKHLNFTDALTVSKCIREMTSAGSKINLADPTAIPTTARMDLHMTFKTNPPPHAPEFFYFNTRTRRVTWVAPRQPQKVWSLFALHNFLTSRRMIVSCRC